ncbi:MAG: glycosyltransferase family 9 protein [Candidatus Binataceae bacterium]|jgi:ADP-heptose:LPS heptosyltransferase
MPTNPTTAKSTVARSVLVIFPGALGDLICLIPTLRALARRHPGASVELMARAELARFATGRLGVVHGHSIDRREVAQLFAAGTRPIATEARTYFGSFDQIYSFFAADDERFRGALDAASDGRASYFPFHPPGAGHVAECYLRLIDPDAREMPSNALDCSFELNREDLDLAEDRLAGLGLEVGQFIIVLPGSGSIAKNWPAENFAALAAALAARIRPLVILGPAEAAIEPVFVAGGLPVIAQVELAEVAALARLSGYFVGNDSGVSHLAAAAGAPGFALFGPTEPARWRPLGRTTVIQREPLSALTPAEVEAAVLEIIGSRKSE